MVWTMDGATLLSKKEKTRLRDPAFQFPLAANAGSGNLVFRFYLSIAERVKLGA